MDGTSEFINKEAHAVYSAFDVQCSMLEHRVRLCRLRKRSGAWRPRRVWPRRILVRRRHWRTAGIHVWKQGVRYGQLLQPSVVASTVQASNFPAFLLLFTGIQGMRRPALATPVKAPFRLRRVSLPRLERTAQAVSAKCQLNEVLPKHADHADLEKHTLRIHALEHCWVNISGQHPNVGNV